MARRDLPPSVAAAVAESLRRTRPAVAAPGPRPIAKATRAPGAKGMNKLESAWAERLRARELAGEVAWWRWEGLTLKLGADVRYTPDFAVVLASGEMECHETKGFFRDDAKAKLRIAADLYPFRFRLIQRAKDGTWSDEEVATR